MTKRIFKYPIELREQSEILIPEGSKILSVVNQREEIVLYAIVDPGRELKPVRIRVEGTGWNIVTDHDEFIFLGTVSMCGGEFMWHIFYKESRVHE
jgi:hypothetical protein